MGIYIHGMKMPKDGECIVISSCGTARKYDPGDVLMYGDAYNEMADAVELPPHGRLIDADALIADLKRQCREVFRVDAVSPDDFWITRIEAYNERLWGTWCESFFDYLQTRPTIIPAEEV